MENRSNKRENKVYIGTISNEKSHEIVEDKKFILLDIRTPQEFNAFHIENAINIDYYNYNFKTELEKLDKNKNYLIYCRTAHRTKGGLTIMKNLGFQSVVDMDGGIVQWLKNGYKIVK